MEHRWGHRHAVTHHVRLRTREGETASGEILNISVSGALILTDLQASILTHVTVDFGASRQSPGSASLEAQVVRRTQGGIAVEWTEFAAPTLRGLAPLAPSETLDPL